MVTAKKRMTARLDDARHWGRYVGRLYTGEGGRSLLVVETYMSVSTFSPGASSAAYAQELGRRASEYKGGVAKTRWKRGDPMPNPTADQIAHPKRLMMADDVAVAAARQRGVRWAGVLQCVGLSWEAFSLARS